MALRRENRSRCTYYSRCAGSSLPVYGRSSNSRPQCLSPGGQGKLVKFCTFQADTYSKHTKQVPVIMLSGSAQVFDKMMGRLAGVSDYITKPFEPETIRRGARSIPAFLCI